MFKKNLYYLITLLPLIFLVVFNAVFFLSPSFSLVKNIVSFTFITVIPGYLLMSLISPSLKNFWIKVSYSVGLSITLLMFGGLALNSTLPLFGVIHPLSSLYLRCFLSVIVIILSIIKIILAQKIQQHFQISSLKPFDIILFVFPPVLILLSVLGALALNNGGSNILTLLMLLFSAFFIVALSFLKKIKTSQVSWLIYCLALALLFMLSLRSSYLVGWDVHTEFTMFQQTNKGDFWSMDAIRNAYNACLSITILPTIISNLTQMSEVYIYKIYYQIIFAFFPVILFSLFKKYVSTPIAFLSVIYLISQPLFIQPMTGLMRQEIGLLFFVLLIEATFRQTTNKKTKILLQIIFGGAMVISHYSTTYIALLLIIGNYSLSTFKKICLFLYTYFKKNNSENKSIPSENQQQNISFIFVFVLTFFTICWYGLYTKTANNIVHVATNVVENSKDLFKADAKSQEAKASLSFSDPKINFTEQLDRYITNKDIIFDSYKVERYTPEEYNKYPVVIYEQKSVPSVVDGAFNNYILNSFQLFKTLSKMLIVIGILFLLRLKSKRLYDTEFIYFIALGLLLIAGILLHPTLSLSYNVSRLLIQMLVFLAVIAVVGGISTLFFLQERTKYFLFSTFLALVFLSYSGFFFQFFGGIPYMHLNNYGNDYDKFFIHDSEVQSALWLNKHRTFKIPIFSDDTSSLRLQQVLGFSSNQVIIPSLLYRDSYVYARYANIVDGRAETNAEGKELIFNFPKAFLENNKDTIYSNGESVIYR